MKTTFSELERYLVINKYINRPLASLVVKAGIPTSVTPNQLTVTSFVLGLIGAYLFYQGKPIYFLWGGILAQASSVVDCADGMLARARSASSEFGAFLDIFLDRINEFFLMCGFTIGLYRYSGNVILLAAGFFALSLYFLHVSQYHIVKKMTGNMKNADTNEARALLLFLIFFFGAVNRLDLGVFTLIAVSSGINIFLVVSFLREGRRLQD